MKVSKFKNAPDIDPVPCFFFKSKRKRPGQDPKLSEGDTPVGNNALIFMDFQDDRHDKVFGPPANQCTRKPRGKKEGE